MKQTRNWKKIVIVTIGTLQFWTGSVQAQARTQEPPTPIKKLICTSGRVYETFEATLNYWGSGDSNGAKTYFTATDASLTDNFAHADFTCVGDTLKDLACVGYLFSMAGDIVELTLIEQKGKFSAVYKSVNNQVVIMHHSPWPCTIQ